MQSEMHCKIAHSPEDAQRAVIELTVVNSRLGRAPRLPAGHHHGCVAGAVWWHVRSRTQEIGVPGLIVLSDSSKGFVI